MSDCAPAVLPPMRHERDLFICDLADAMPKDDLGSMEHPIFSLSTKPDRSERLYRRGDVEVRVIPSILGLATIHDKDVLIYCVSQLVAAVNDGRPVSRSVSLTAHDLLIATNRAIGGKGYRRLVEALERLQGTNLVTTLATGGQVIQVGFGLIDGWYVERETRDGRMISLHVTLSEWLYRAVLASEVLSISPDYFRLRKPLERRIYELARKHCGGQPRWRVGLDVLQSKCGAGGTLRRFRSRVRGIIDADHLPEYRLALSDDVLVVEPRSKPSKLGHYRGPPIRPETWDMARSAAPGYDVYALHEDWRVWWVDSGEPALRSPDAAFVGFCRQRWRRSPL